MLKNTLFIGNGATVSLKQALKELPNTTSVTLLELATTVECDIKTAPDSMLNVVGGDVQKALTTPSKLTVITDLQKLDGQSITVDTPVYATIEASSMVHARELMNEQQISIVFEKFVLTN